jgi:serine protease
MIARNAFFRERHRLARNAIVAMVCLAVSGMASGGEFRTTSGPKSDRQYIVIFNEDDAKAAMDLLEADLSRYAAEQGFAVREIWKHAIHGASVTGLDEFQARLLSQRAGVDYVEEDPVGQPSASQTPAPTGLDRIDQRNLPLNNVYTYNKTGLGVNAYVLDSGVRLTHQEFLPAGRATLDFNVLNDGQTGDTLNHGTPVASLIGGTTYGVAKQARIRSIRFCGNGNTCTASNAITALDWVAAHGLHPGVVNLSYRWPGNLAIDTAVTGVYNAGFFVAVSANETHGNACDVSPSRASAAYAVSGVDSHDVQPFEANGGPCVDIYALYTNRAASNHSDIENFSFMGTSGSAPLVAGVAALILQGNPNATPLAVRSMIDSWATWNVLSGMTLGAPNKMLFSNPAAQ